MPDAQNGSLIITVLTFDGTAFGIAQNLSLNLPASVKPLQNQGMLGFGALGIVALGGVLSVTWVAGPGATLFTRGTKGDIAYTSKDAVGGATQSRPMTNMVALDGALVHSDREYCIFTQMFMNEDDAGEPLS